MVMSRSPACLLSFLRNSQSTKSSILPKNFQWRTLRAERQVADQSFNQLSSFPTSGSHLCRSILKRVLSTSTMPKVVEQKKIPDGELDSRMVWVDLEMSGLDPELYTILEMAVVVTDGDLNIIAESPDVVINHSEDVISTMSQWCKDTFAKSGLTQEIRASKVSLPQAEQMMMEFLRPLVSHQKCPLAGNSVNTDRIFLKRYMPQFENLLHYRIVDVSTIKELSRRWYPDLHDKQPKKRLEHRANSDIRESIDELKWYRENIFRQRTPFGHA